MKKDYYEILGIKKDASAEEIKKVYRQLAMRYHPDRVEEKEKKSAEERFKEISEAYGVLSDVKKRQTYDQYGHSGIDQNYTSEDIFRGADFSSVFGEGNMDEILGHFFGDAFGGGGGRRSRRAARGRDIQYEVEIPLEEAFKGIKKTIKVPRNEVCRDCQGTGAKGGTAMTECASCGGQGQVMINSGFFRLAQTCPTCRGAGHNRVVRNIDVTFPPGLDNDSQMRMRGEGEVGPGGAGDLYIFIRVSAHPKFRRSGRDLEMDLLVAFTQAALGGEVTADTLAGPVTMKLPAGTESGKVFRLKGKGMPDVHDAGTTGDLYARVMVDVPKKLSAEQRRILEEFAKASGEEVSSGSIKDKIKKVFK